MKRAYDFLKECGTFYIATTDADQPKVRPFGAVAMYEGRMYFCTSNQKDVFAQMKKNVNVEICCSKNGEWLRLSGKTVFNSTAGAQAAMLEENPNLKRMYSVGDGIFEVFYIDDACAVIRSFAGRNDIIRF